MSIRRIHHNLHIIANSLALLFICAVLVIAIFEQFFGSALPCPLCYLQRVGYIGMGVTMCLNLNRGPRPFHYGLLILATLFLMVTAGRQVLLHILPGSTTYGDALFGLSAYTWNAILAFIAIICVAIALMFQHGFHYPGHLFSRLSKVIISIFLLIVLINLVSVFLECGFSACPDNPVGYKYNFFKKDSSVTIKTTKLDTDKNGKVTTEHLTTKITIRTTEDKPSHKVAVSHSGLPHEPTKALSAHVGNTTALSKHAGTTSHLAVAHHN